MPTTVYSQVLIHTVEWPGEGKLKTIAQGLTWQRKIQTCAIMLIHHMYACWIIYTKFNTDIFFYLNLLIQFLGSLLITKWFTSEETLFHIFGCFSQSSSVDWIVRSMLHVVSHDVSHVTQPWNSAWRRLRDGWNIIWKKGFLCGISFTNIFSKYYISAAKTVSIIKALFVGLSTTFFVTLLNKLSMLCLDI